MRPLPKLKRGGYLVADDLNALMSEVARLGHVHLLGGSVVQNPGGVLLTPPSAEVGFWARVTYVGDSGSGSGCGSGSGSGGGDDCEGALYEFEEVEHQQGGRFATRTGGRSGECYEVNRWHTPNDSVVWMRSGWAKLRCGLVVQEYLFQYEGLYRDECDGGSGSGSGCGSNAGGTLGPVVDVCCDGSSLRVVYASDLG